MEDENHRLKQMFADLLVLKTTHSKPLLKKALAPAIKREPVNCLTTQFPMSIRQACKILSLSRTVFRYQLDTQRDGAVIRRLIEVD